MFDSSNFHEIVSGRKRGPAAMLFRGLLRVAEVPYTLAVQLRNRRFDRSVSAIERVEVPVISIGNLTLGGTGKTPMVKWVARYLRANDLRVAILSRGYGATEGAKNDEALELEQSLPDVPHLQSPDRVAIARTAIEELESQVLLQDDGFQHRRLGRDLDIVLIDATQPFGFGHVFPRGTLREPLRGLGRAGVVCLTRADRVSPQERESIRSRVARLAPQAHWCEVVHAPQSLLDAAGNLAPLSQLAGRRVAAFCGIGNPAAFRSTLEGVGATVVHWREFPDHHAFTAADVESLTREITTAQVDHVVCTHKDLVKLRVGELGGVSLWAVVVEMDFLSGREGFERAIAGAVQRVFQQTDPSDDLA